MKRKDLKKAVNFILAVYFIVFCTCITVDMFAQSVYVPVKAADLTGISETIETEIQTESRIENDDFNDSTETDEVRKDVEDSGTQEAGESMESSEKEGVDNSVEDSRTEETDNGQTEESEGFRPENGEETEGGNDWNLYAEPRVGSLYLNSYNGGGTITLTEDVTAYYQCQLNGSLTIDLNGHTMTMTNQGSFMLMDGKASLTIKDSAGGGVIEACCQLIWCYGGGTVNLYGGTLDGSKATSYGQHGGCVWLPASMNGDSTFNMYGGTIQNFRATNGGGAVYVEKYFHGHQPMFNMYGGTIKDCYAPAGAAIYVEDDKTKPGYCYIKGGAKKAEGGESKVTIHCTEFPGETVSNAIYVVGYFGLEGVVDIDGIVYLEQNNWASSDKRFIKVTGRLTVLGNGYIEVDSAYPGSNAVCPGHTVVANATRLEGTGPEITPQEFYTYSSFFVNKNKNLLISGGFDPDKNELDANGAPANWPTNQGDKLTNKYEYVDAMGQTMLIQALDAPGDKRLQQSYDYLIYTERADLSVDYAEYYSFKISKRDLDSSDALNGVTFSLKKMKCDEEGNPIRDAEGKIEYEPFGTSGATGDYYNNGVENGETYIYIDSEMAGKMMADDGIYVLSEESAPPGYILRENLATIHIYHTMDESTGKPVSVVEITANDKVLTTEEQVIDSTYGDTGKILNREIVLLLHNSTRALNAQQDYQVRIEKYADSGYTVPLAGAGFVLCETTDDSTVVAQGVSNAEGIVRFLDNNGSVFTFSNGASYRLAEESPPEGFYAMEFYAQGDGIVISVDEDNQLRINGSVIGDGEETHMTAGNADLIHGSWMAALSETVLTFKIYDEKMPPTWTLTARKFGSQAIEVLAMAGAKFTLYRIEVIEGMERELEVAQAVSSDGTDGSAKGTFIFRDSGGLPLKLECNAVYLLRETYAPLGYALMKDIRMEINAEGTVINVTREGNTLQEAAEDDSHSGAVYDSENRILTLSLVDETVYRLPETGGCGIGPVAGLGIITMCSCGIILLLLYHEKEIVAGNRKTNNQDRRKGEKR